MEPREPDGSDVVEASALRERTQQRLQDYLRFRHLNHNLSAVWGALLVDLQSSALRARVVDVDLVRLHLLNNAPRSMTRFLLLKVFVTDCLKHRDFFVGDSIHHEPSLQLCCCCHHAEALLGFSLTGLT